MSHFVLMISLDLTKSSEVRKAGDWSDSVFVYLDLGQANLPLVSDQLSNLNNVEFKGYFSMPVWGLCNPCSL